MLDIVKDQNEKDKTIVIDGRMFDNCVFTNCTLVYSGGDYGWVNTKFIECKVSFFGPAVRVLEVAGYFGMLKKEDKKS